MQQPPLSPLPPGHGFTIKDALPYSLAIIAAAGSWFAARSTAFAQLSRTVLDASRRLVLDTQAVHAQDGALISELTEKLRAQDLELLRKDGEIRQHLQQVDSFRRAWEAERNRNKECKCPKPSPPQRKSRSPLRRKRTDS